MTIESYLVAEMLQRLEQQLTMVRPNAVEIAAAISRDQYPAALTASAELHRALDAFVATTEILEDHIVARDGLGPLGDAIGELALRGRGLVIVAQLDLLQTALVEPAIRSRTTRWYTGRFHGVAEVSSFLGERLAHIHSIWTPYRRDQPALPGMTEADRVTIYRTMIRVAQRAMSALPDDPDLARFLESGAAAADLPEIHAACKWILTVLDLQIDVELVRPSKRRPHRTVPINAVADRR